MKDPLRRLYRTKSFVLATSLGAVGILLMTLGIWATHGGSWQTLVLTLVIEAGGGLFTTGLLGVGLQYFIDEDKDELDSERIRRAITEASPAMRDAVINGFAFEPDDLARVATPEVLDQIVRNGLALRLGDAGFARDLYDDLQQQAIQAPERLHDARISIHLSPLPAGRGTAEGRASYFVATVRWEADLHPKHAIRHFSCTSDLQEFRALAQDKRANSAWYISPSSGLDAASTETFELLDFTVDGQPRHITRTEKQGGQAYSVSLGEDAMHSRERVTVGYVYRTLTAVDDHLLRLRVDQPTRGLSIEFDYTNTAIERVTVLDFIAGSETSRITRSPKQVPERVVTVNYDGWAMPRSGVAFVWVNQQASPDQLRAKST